MSTSDSWLYTFLSRVAKPTYFRSNSRKEIHQDFTKARLDDELRRVNHEITYLENRRKDITIMEVIESTVKNKPILRRFKINLPTVLSRTPSIRHLEEDDDFISHELDSKALMLENERQIQAYQKLRNKIRAAIVVRQRIFSVVYRTPPEIWGQIFIFCLPDVEYLEPDASQAPLVLCRVNNMWRNAAMHTPSLWNSLVVRLREQTTRKAFLRTWIGRSGVLPLSLHILWGPTQSLHFHDRVFHYLLSIAHRWQNVKLSIVKGLAWQSQGFPTRAHKLLSYPMPILKTLVLEPYLPLGVTNLERNAPGLRELWLMNSAINPMHLMSSSNINGSSPWHQLKSFRSAYPLDTPHAVRIFKLCPNLVECEVALALAEPVSVRGMVKMQKLESLTINETGPGILDAFFRVLEAPALKELTLNAISGNLVGDNPWSAREVLLLVKRSAMVQGDVMLTTLRVKGLNCDQSVVRDLVFGIPTLLWFDMRYREKELLGHSWVRNLRKDASFVFPRSWRN